MLGFSTSRDGLLQLSEEQLAAVVHKEPILDHYGVDKTPLGRGKYATVCRAVHKETGVEYAAKFVKKRRRNQDQMKEIIHEIAVLMQCSSTNRVIRLHEVYESATEMVLVLELAAGGELQHILDGGQCLGEAEARKAMKQILDGVSFLHERNIVHLDLKPQNLLLSIEDNCDDIKLCDFGISKVLEPGVKVREIIGTVDYVAPEVLSYDPICLSTDIWSIGVLAYVLLSGYTPFGADDKQQTFLNISKCALSFEPDHFEDVSSPAIDFIKSALVTDPRKRPTVHELLEHPWISLKCPLLPALPLKPSESVPSIKSISETPKSQRKTFCSDALSGSLSTFTVSSNCLCPQCGTACRHLTHTPVPKTAITVDRGILC
ncbi:death-associated protein kinase related [Tribolium castaneum]|uniref:non-specific serine/threonine protein kinase n=1 Tax=Tribolium castaneum TaxID=7070 RepID=A0A139WBW5_TRICA|nr:PREDICTED: death-associated protein kinase related [Tribolium castaneum]KYB25355.1 Death-associated protein kinase related-like Protein [Tribolium castaneum]|eukprot:XP_973170.1 PREDICTED: death-associated protein kinase related [Tribolium castaneum]